MNKNRVSIPKEVDGCAVEQSGDPMEHRGQKWQTLVPTDYENDGRIWEFSMTTGRIICTVSA